LLERPLFCFGKIGGTGEPGANAIEQATGVFHDVRVVDSFIADAGDGLEIERLGSGLG
jgi:hypothetical protein